MRTGKGLELAFDVALALSLLTACGGTESTASRSAAAYDQAQREGTPIEGAGAHVEHGPPAAAEEPGEDVVSSPAATASEGAHPGREGASGRRDHAAMGHGEMGGAAPTSAGTGGPRRATASAPIDHAAMGHGAMSERTAAGGLRHPDAGSAPTGHAAMGHAQPGQPEGRPAMRRSGGAMDHAAMGHSAGAMPAPSPEPVSAVASPGQPAATLRPNDLDTPPGIALQEAARAAALALEMAAGGHAMGHGTYRQVDAGRADVPIDSPRGEGRQGSAAPPEGAHPSSKPDLAAPSGATGAPGASPAGAGHEGHGPATPTAPRATPDPHAGHGAPAPMPKPSPSPKADR